MTSRRPGAGGFTLFEVLAAVLILGVFYTVLADQAIRGLRSEGMDRRRAEAALIADIELVALETVIATGAPLEPMREETEIDGYSVLIEVLPEEVQALLPPPPIPDPQDRREEELPSLLVDENGDSRFYRLFVDVSWEEAGARQQVQRRTWNLDRSVLAGMFPPNAGDTPTDFEDLEGAEASGSDNRSSSGSASGSSRGSRSSSRSSDDSESKGSAGRRSGGGGGSAPELTIQQMLEILRRSR